MGKGKGEIWEFSFLGFLLSFIEVQLMYKIIIQSH